MERISPLIFRTEDRTYRVEQKGWRQRKFKRDHAYLLSKHNDYVYPYRGEIEDIRFHQVGIYVLTEPKKKVVVIRPKNDYDKRLYSKGRIIELTPDIIFTDLKDDINEIPEITITEGDIFNPPISREDDIALAGLKYAISQKKIDFNNYGPRFESTAQKNNGRRALTHGNTLKMEMLDRFCSVFDLNAGIIYWDKEDCVNPMSKDEKRVFIIFNDESVDLKDPDVIIEEIERKG